MSLSLVKSWRKCVEITCTKLGEKKRETWHIFWAIPSISGKKRASTAFFFFLLHVFFYCLAEIFFFFFFLSFIMRKKSALSTFHYLWTCFFGEGNHLSISLGRSRWDKKVFFARKFGILKHTVHVWIQPCWDFSWCHSKALNVQCTALKWGNTERAHNTGGYLLISLMATSVSRKTRACTFLTQFCVLLFVFYTVQNGWFLPVLLHVAHRSSVTSNRKFFFCVSVVIAMIDCHVFHFF